MKAGCIQNYTRFESTKWPQAMLERFITRLGLVSAPL